MFKNYTRLKQIRLPDFSTKRYDLRKALLSRSSYRNFSKKPVSSEQLSEILYYSAGVVRKDGNDFRRPYPSAGGKYPIEIYPLVLFAKDLDKGLYHFDPQTHTLDVLLPSLKDKDISGIWKMQKWFKKASVILIFTAVYTRTTEK